MFDRLIHFSIHNKLIVGLLTLALVVWGGYSLAHLPIDAVPDITTNQVVVYTVAPSLAAADFPAAVVAVWADRHFAELVSAAPTRAGTGAWQPPRA